MARRHLVLLAVMVAVPVLAPAQAIFSDGFESWDLSGWSETTLPPWLEYLDRFRAQAGVQWPDEDLGWSDGCWKHSRYCVKNDVITHTEELTNTWYTPEGDAAGQSGNVAVSSWNGTTDEFFLDLWMRGPFHAVGMIDPRLASSGFGSYRETIGNLQAAATIDVLRGRGAVPAGTTFPLVFPGNGGRTWILSYGGNELPDPLTSCPNDYSTPTGPPLILQLGSGSLTPTVGAHAVLDGTTPVDHCVFTETTYTNPNSTYQSLGRNVLGARDAVVVMPRNPLTAGHTYTVNLTVNGTAYSWSFTATATSARSADAGDDADTGMGTPPGGGPG